MPTVILLSSRGEKSSKIKGTNYIPLQTFGLMSKWGSVVISTLSPQSPCFSLSRATCTRASPDVTLPAWTAPEGQLIPLSAAALLISHMAMAGRNRHYSGLHRPPRAGRDLPAKPCEYTQKKNKRKEERCSENGVGLQQTSHLKNIKE